MNTIKSKPIRCYRCNKWATELKPKQDDFGIYIYLHGCCDNPAMTFGGIHGKTTAYYYLEFIADNREEQDAT